MVGASSPQVWDMLERLSRVATLLAAAVASASAVVAVLLTIAFPKIPFPGVLVEQSLVVTHHEGSDWSGRQAGLGHPQRIVRMGGRPVRTPGELRQVLAGHSAGERVSVLAVSPDGDLQLFPDVRLATFATRDALRYFLLPYVIGIAYLAIGMWVYRVSGAGRPGRVLAFFCFSTAVVCILLFDLTSSHVGPMLWTTALALSAGALSSLAMRFPQTWGPVERRSWLLAVPYILSLVLAAGAVTNLADTAKPWAYIEPWGAIYRCNGVAIVLFLAVMLHRARSGGTRLSRQQARIVLAGSAVALLPVTVFFVSPLLGTDLLFDPVLFLPTLIVFPLALMVAIVRYRILDMDLIVSRTLLHGALTAVLSGVFAVSITISQTAFMSITGERRDAAVVLTTLIVVSVVTPIRSRLQGFLDREFQDGLADAVPLRRFGEQWRTVHAFGDWRGDARLVVPMRCRGVQEGVLSLGPRHGGRSYTQAEARDLEDLGDYVIRSMRLATALRRVTGMKPRGVE